MLSGELASRAKKLEREQAERLDKARARAEKERLVAERHRQREEARTEELRHRRLAQETAREAVRSISSAFLKYRVGPGLEIVCLEVHQRCLSQDTQCEARFDAFFQLHGPGDFWKA